MRTDDGRLKRVGDDLLPWLLEEKNPSARFWTLTELLDQPLTDPEVAAAQQAIPDMPVVRRILDAQWPDGFWMHPGVGYSPLHKATVWQIIFLAQLGLARCLPIERAVEYVLAHSRLSGGLVPGTEVPEARFSAHKDRSGAILCLNGNLLRALSWFGYGEDPRLRSTRAAVAAQAVRDGFRCRFSGRTPAGRRPARMRDGLPCAWGTIKSLGGLLSVPADRRTPSESLAIEEAARFLADHDVTASEPSAESTASPLWLQFGFPLAYTADLVEWVDVLLEAKGEVCQRTLAAIERILSKQDGLGRWTLEHSPGNMWAACGRRGSPDKWVTLRALRAIKKVRELGSVP